MEGYARLILLFSLLLVLLPSHSHGMITTGEGRCIRSCVGRSPGYYQSCNSCHHYAVCDAGRVLLDNQPCPANLVWNDDIKTCDWFSPTCRVSTIDPLRPPIDGQWGPWGPWSRCTKTCNTGMRTRHRDCNAPPPMNGGAACMGIPTQMQDCNVFPCPDCSRPCVGNWNSDCTLCECPSQVLSGIVVIWQIGIPLPGVDIFAQTNGLFPIATSAADGSFSIVGLCQQDLVLTATRLGFISEFPSYLASSFPANAIFIQMLPTSLRITENPLPQGAFDGESVTFSCNAVGVPPVSHFDWFHNTNVIRYGTPGDLSSRFLTLSAVNVGHNGEYECRAVNALTSRKSMKARLVVGSNCDEDTCRPFPLPHLKRLPPSCTVIGGGSLVDVGKCDQLPCKRKSNPNPVLPQCCEPIEYVAVPIVCVIGPTTITYTLTRATKCGCTACQLGGDITIKGLVVFVELLVDGTLQTTPVNRIITFTASDEVHFTTLQGTFSFSAVQTESNTITLAFDPYPWDPFMPHVHVVDVRPGITCYTLLVELPLKPSPIVINEPAAGFQVDFPSGSPGAPQVVRMSVPPGSVFSATGVPITDPINVFVRFLDPRNPASLGMAPGTFRFENDDGDGENLQTAGVTQVVVEAGASSAYISGSITFNLDPDELGLTVEDGVADYQWWSPDLTTGGWKFSDMITQDGFRRRKRDLSDLEATTTIPPGVCYLNIDKPLLADRQCHVAVRVYQDEDCLVPDQGTKVTVFTRDTTFPYAVLGYYQSYTNQNGLVCIPIACGLIHEISVFSPFCAEPKPVQNITADIDWAPIGENNIAFASPEIDAIVGTDGPVYPGKSTFDCFMSDPGDYHFSFFINEATPLQGALFPAVPLPFKRMSWYSQTADDLERDACFVRVGVTVAAGDAKPNFIGMSENSGGPLGFYSTGVDSFECGAEPGEYFACIQVKCPNDAYDEDLDLTFPAEPTDVRIFVTQDDDKCKYRDSIASTRLPLEVVSTGMFGVDLLLKTPYYKSCGFYHHNGTQTTAAESAKWECAKGIFGTFTTFDCTAGANTIDPQCFSGGTNGPFKK